MLIFKLVLPIPAGRTQRYVVFDTPQPDADYGVDVEFDFSAGDYWVTDKSAAKFKVHWATTSPGSQTATIFVYRS